MRGLTILVATDDTARFRAALATAAAAAALGARARVFLHEAAADLLVARPDADAARLAAAGVPTQEQLLEIARESGVALIVCQTGLARAGLSMETLSAGAEAGGLVSLLGTLGEDRLLAF
ncbi:DsrE family protein [Sphingomonas sp. PL-96]|uniref:DsrE family protein n=1 Tax=Sphingomonas sp. PL-96 TaxID=2887201 RepID=UPI001E499E23|nr:DsrE family protein [Sphingomonas sp. PL-96]MCC2976319.1 DsrE family protein [Sphingomonas sp. PL-96]